MEAKKVDLLSFQKNLNKQFIEIFEAKQRDGAQSAQSIDLGLKTAADNFQFFILLKDLKNISMNNNYEESKLLMSWVCGFNQMRGEVYTIMDFQKTINYLVNGKDDKNYRKLGVDHRIIYMKEYSDEKMGLVIDDIDWAYTPEFTLLFSQSEDEEKKYWNLNEDLEFDSFVKKENMSKDEYDILLTAMKKEVIKEYSEEAKKDIFFYLISDIYLDVLGKRPIFVLDAENLTKVLINISQLKQD